MIDIESLGLNGWHGTMEPSAPPGPANQGKDRVPNEQKTMPIQNPSLMETQYPKEAQAQQEPPALKATQGLMEAQLPIESNPNQNPPIAAMAAEYAGQLSQRFAQQFGYAPADEIVFGWQMEAEAKLQAAQAESQRMLHELEEKLEDFEAAFEASGLPKCAGKHFVNLIKENGLDILEQEDLHKLAIAQAIGLAILEGELPPSSAPTLKGESVAGETSTPKNRAKEIDEARRSLKLILKREPTQGEIQEWLDL